MHEQYAKDAKYVWQELLIHMYTEVNPIRQVLCTQYASGAQHIREKFHTQYARGARHICERCKAYMREVQGMYGMWIAQ